MSFSMNSKNSSANFISGIELPHNLDAEQAVLGGLIYNNLFYEKVPFLSRDHFFNPVHQEIFAAIVNMIQKGQLVTPITIAPIFKDHPAIIEAGAQKYWVNLVSAIGSIANIEANANHIYELALRRAIILISQEAIIKANKFESDKDAQDLVEETEVALFNVSTTRNAERKVKTFHASLQEAVFEAKKASENSSLVGVTTGLDHVDQHLGGFHPSDLIILAGRPSMGKTALATTFAFNAARAFNKNPTNGARVAFFSLEMSAQQLAMRILGQESGISSDRIRRGSISHKEFLSLEKKAQELFEVPLFIDDTPGLTMASLRTRARRLHRQEKIGMIVIDYLQLLSSGSRHGYENRVQELTEITRGLKALAKELNLPIIALSQLSRAVEQREDKQPQLADLRESGSIEQDADVVSFIYRESYYESRKKPNAGSEKMQEWQSKMSRIYNLADLIIAKQRHGPIGTIHLHFDEKVTKFSNLAQT